MDPKRTPHACDEFAAYEYEKNAQDEWISGYPEKNSRTVTAVRHALSPVIYKSGSHA
jgi:hypothetical protein